MKNLCSYLLLYLAGISLFLPSYAKTVVLNQEKIESELIEDIDLSRKKSNKPKVKKVDYIIVGNGTAGAVLARKLSDNFKNKVYVLEAGINRTTDPIVTNPNPFSVQNIITYDPKYSISYPVVLFTPREVITYTEGRMWGGSSAHNYVTAVRGTPNIYDYWAQVSGNPLWSYNSLLPHMINMETYTPNGTIANLNERGATGPLFITQAPNVSTNPIALAISHATNTPIVSDYNDPTQGILGISATQQYITPGSNSQRSFSIPAFLPVGEIINKKGKGIDGRHLHIISDAYVNRIIFKGKKAIGVEYILNNDSNEVIRVYARKKIILSAGAINSPAILQRSGIGDSSILEPLGIPVLVNNPNVGANLVTQYGVEGIIATGGGDANIASFINLAPYMPNTDTRRVQISLAGLGPTRTGLLNFILLPKSRGTVQIVDQNPLIQPLVNLNLFSDGPVTTQGTDAYVAVSIYKMVRDVANQLNVAVLYPPPADYASDATLLADAKTLASLVVENHISGTAQMSLTPDLGVVNGDLEVFGVKNLMIADNSVVPLIEDGNTAYQAYLIGLTAAKIIKHHQHD